MCFGFSASVLTHVHFIYLGANPGTSKPNSSNIEISGQERYLAIKNETIYLICAAVIPVENSVCVFDSCASINWIFGGKAINAISRNVFLNDSILNVTSSLQISNVDQSNAGVYTCGLIVGVTTVAARSLSLTIYG